MRPLKKEYTERPTMSAPLDPVKIQAAMSDLGVSPVDMERLRQMTSVEEATTWLDELKARVRKNFKQLAFELHPDRTGGDEEKTARFKLYGTVKDEFEKIQVQARQVPNPQAIFQQIQQQMLERLRQQHVQAQRQAPIQAPARVVMWSSVGSTVAHRTGAVSVQFGVPLRVATLKPT